MPDLCTCRPPLLTFSAGMFSPSLGTRLAHLCDAVVTIEGVSDTSGLVRLVPDSARWAKQGACHHCFVHGANLLPGGCQIAEGKMVFLCMIGFCFPRI